MNVSFFYFYNKEKSKHLDRWKEGWVNGWMGGWAGGWVDGKTFGEWQSFSIPYRYILRKFRLYVLSTCLSPIFSTNPYSTGPLYSLPYPSA